MATLNNVTGKILYGILFMLLLPLCLYLWTRGLSPFIHIPVPGNGLLAITVSAAGFFICGWGMLALMLYGKGLPMNAYPPALYVSKNIYGLLHHPIYTGAGILSFGLSLYFRSSAGFWLVSPLFCLAMIAFVYGYENEKIKAVPGYFNNAVFFSLPSAAVTPASLPLKMKVLLFTLVPWALLYQLFVFMGKPADAVSSSFGFEKNWPVLQWTEMLYVLPYLLLPMALLLQQTKNDVRNFALDAYWAMGIGFFMYAAFPFVAAQRPFAPVGFWGTLISEERSYDSAAAALPAFHVIWAFIMARYFSIRFGAVAVWYLLAICIAASCVANGNHSIADVLAGYFVFLIAQYRQKIWDRIRVAAERIANSWHEWHFGKARLINHGMYGGAAAFAGLFVTGICLPAQQAHIALIVGVAAIAGAALWAQIVEGSPKLLRPYGYYGSVIGILLSVGLIVLFYDTSFLYLLAAFGLGGPWVQVLGRLRCLVQGCCHGKPCGDALGIKFIHPQSRVLRIASLKGVPVHPTQLYSIGSNILIGLLLFRFVSLAMPVSFIAGMYFILNGLARFVEEALRGEPQTAYWGDLRLYQWLALINIIGGAAITCIPSTEHLVLHFNSAALLYAVAAFFIATVAYGMDFPGSNKRFARLTS